MLFISCQKLFFVEIFTFLFELFGYVEKQLDKVMINFKIYVTGWAANNSNIHIAQQLAK